VCPAVGPFDDERSTRVFSVRGKPVVRSCAQVVAIAVEVRLIDDLLFSDIIPVSDFDVDVVSTREMSWFEGGTETFSRIETPTISGVVVDGIERWAIDRSVGTVFDNTVMIARKQS